MSRALFVLVLVATPALAQGRPILTPKQRASAVEAWKNRARFISKATTHLYVRLKLKRHVGRFFGWRVKLGDLTVNGKRSFQAWPSKYGRYPTPGEKISSAVYGYVKAAKGGDAARGPYNRVRIEHSYVPLRGLEDLHRELARDNNAYYYIGPAAR